MKKKGSITVFLSLILVLLFSLLLTTLEAARVVGGTAYLKMLSAVAADSVCARYYVPLLDHYGLMGILADDSNGMFSEKQITESLKNSISFGTDGMEGGLLQFSGTETELLSYRTMLTEDGTEFICQVKEQVMLDGVEQLLSGLFLEEEGKDAAQAGLLYQKQQEAFEQTATITKELLALMELVDGIQTNKEGLCTDKAGRLKAVPFFIKQLTSMSEEELERQFKQEEIFRTVKDGFFWPAERAAEVAELLVQAMLYQAEIAELQEEIEYCADRQTEIARELLKNPGAEEKERLLQEKETLIIRKKEAMAARDERVEWLDLVWMDAQEQYEVLKQKMDAVEPLLSEALKIVNGLEQKQKTAQISVMAYETFLKEIETEVSKELYTVFEEELQNMKLYAGLEDQGYRVSVMEKTLAENKKLLEDLRLPEFSAASPEELYRGIKEVEERIGEYSLEGLWFTYGRIAVAENITGNVAKTLEQLLQTGILSLVGVTSDEFSKKEISGEELPSAGMETEKKADLLSCFSEMSELFQREGFLEILSGALEYSLDMVALELYGRQYFGCYGQEKEHTRLSYEREYLLFGEEKDIQNLVLMVMYLVAIRSVFTMTAILKDPVKMQELEALAAAVAGLTGIPLLLSVTKYSLLFVWSLEEALVETAALLDGKRLPVSGGQGTLALSEIFLFDGTMVQRKAKELSDGKNGIGYKDYLTILSLTKSVKKKTYRMQDLIQENMRYRYDDLFRMRNVVAVFSFQAETMLEKKMETELWTKEIYRLKVTETVSY